MKVVSDKFFLLLVFQGLCMPLLVIGPPRSESYWEKTSSSLPDYLSIENIMILVGIALLFGIYIVIYKQSSQKEDLNLD
jgi:hypothetical protein